MDGERLDQGQPSVAAPDECGLMMEQAGSGRLAACAEHCIGVGVTYLSAPPQHFETVVHAGFSKDERAALRLEGRPALSPGDRYARIAESYGAKQARAAGIGQRIAAALRARRAPSPVQTAQ